MRLFSTILLFILAISYSVTAKSLNPVEVTDISLKISGRETKEYYYGFEKGDEIRVTFSTEEGKELKEIEILEYPNNVKYTSYEVKTFDKSFTLNNRSIYIFRFHNKSLGKRVISFKIERIPKSSETLNFRTDVVWKEMNDTTYTYTTEKVLISSDTVATELFNKTEQIAALTTLGRPSENLISFNLPYYKTKYETTEVISWAYWIGVGQEGFKAYEANKAKYMQSLGVIANATGNPLIGLALNKFAFLPSGNTGSNVAYFFMVHPTNAQIFINSFDKGGFRFFESGNGSTGYGKMHLPLQGTIYLGLHNDNYHNHIDVNVKVVIVTVNNKYAEKELKQPKVTVKRVPYFADSVKS